MKNLSKRIIAAATALSLVLGIFGVTALGAESYVADTVTSYLNPDTGETDDGGTANAELGEGMCRSAVYEKAVIEETDEGVIITMRMLLYSNLSDIRLAVQDEPGGSYSDVSYNVIKESSSTDSADLRFSAPAGDSYIRITMYVAPMGRDVCFYMNCDMSTAVSGTSLDETEAEDTQTEAEAEETEETNDSAAAAFTDIDGHWAESEIIKAVDSGLFSGTSADTFSPENSMTRGMFVTVLGRMSGEEISGTAEFTDVDNSMYYAPYIAWANANGIVNGTGNGLFSPDTAVTCEQAAVILVKYAAYKGVSFETKSISPGTTGVSSWAEESVVSAGKAGIITKQNTNGYDYTSSATRADVASMLCNYTEYYGN
ncbi:MAG: S-layer homology domain-containing protein [Clostridiales bacterium]|nr:S-layer homology domain-containing protein [Clostridiales bacterium]